MSSHVSLFLGLKGNVERTVHGLELNQSSGNGALETSAWTGWQRWALDSFCDELPKTECSEYSPLFSEASELD